jgi:hypothetical protein
MAKMHELEILFKLDWFLFLVFLPGFRPGRPSCDAKLFLGQVTGAPMCVEVWAEAMTEEFSKVASRS